MVASLSGGLFDIELLVDNTEVSLYDPTTAIELLVNVGPETGVITAAGGEKAQVIPVMLSPTPPEIALSDIADVTIDGSSLSSGLFDIELLVDNTEVSLYDPTTAIELLVNVGPETELLTAAGGEKGHIIPVMLTPTRPEIAISDIAEVTVDGSSLSGGLFDIELLVDNTEVSYFDPTTAIELLVNVGPETELLTAAGGEKSTIIPVMLTPTRPEIALSDIADVTVDGSSLSGGLFDIELLVDNTEVSYFDPTTAIELLVNVGPETELLTAAGGEKGHIIPVMLTPTRPEIAISDIAEVTVDGSSLSGGLFDIELLVDNTEVSYFDPTTAIELLVNVGPETELLTAAGGEKGHIIPVMLTPTRPEIAISDIAEVTVDGSSLSGGLFDIELLVDNTEVSYFDPTTAIELLVNVGPETELLTAAGGEKGHIIPVMLTPTRPEIAISDIAEVTVDGSSLSGGLFDIELLVDNTEVSYFDPTTAIELLVNVGPETELLTAAGGEKGHIIPVMLTPTRPEIAISDIAEVTVDGSSLSGGLFDIELLVDNTEVSYFDPTTAIELLVNVGPETGAITLNGSDGVDDTVDLIATDVSRPTGLSLSKLDSLSFSYASSIAPVDQPEIVHTKSTTGSYVTAGSWLIETDESVRSTSLTGSTLTSRLSGAFDSEYSLVHTATGSHSTIDVFDATFDDDVELIQVGAPASPQNILEQNLSNVTVNGQLLQTVSGGEGDDLAILSQQSTHVAGGSTNIDLKDGSDRIVINGIPAVSITVIESGASDDQDTLTVNGNDEDNIFDVTEERIELDGRAIDYSGMELIVLNGQGGSDVVSVLGTPSTPITWGSATGIGVTGRTLRIIGTDGSDQVSVTQQGNGFLKVHASFLTAGNFTRFRAADVDQIFARLGDGDDHMSVAGNINVPAIILGGRGNDHIKAGRGPSILIGGEGKDRLVGGTAGDVLIGGMVEDDTNAPALLDALFAWNSDEPDESRKDAVIGLLHVLDDGDRDRLNGGPGRDLFYNGVRDVMTDAGKKKDRNWLI